MNTSHIRGLYDARMNTVAQLRSLDAAAGGAPFTAEQRAAEVRMSTEVDRLDNAIRHALTTADQSDAIAAQSYKFEGGEARSADELATNAFLKTARAGDVARFDIGGALEQRAALLKSNTGANAVPVRTFERVVADRINLLNLLDYGVQVVRTTSGEDIKVPTSANRPTASIEGEGDTIAISDGTLGVVTMKAWKYALISQASVELVADNTSDAVGYIGRIAGDAINTALSQDFVTGIDTTEPQGIVTGGAVGKTLAVAATLTSDEVLDWYHSLAQQYRAGAVFVVSDTLVLALRKLKEATTDQYMWQPGLAAGQPDTLLGRPVIVSPDVPTFAAGAARKLGAFFHPEAYMVRVAGDLFVERSDQYAWDTDLVSWKFRLRADGRIVDADGVSVLVNP